MKRKLGIITIGQSPRVDVVPEMMEYLGDNVEVIETGALDGLSYDEILNLSPKEYDYVLVSRLRNGSQVKIAERHIISRLQQCIDYLENKDVDVILFICTGAFPEVFTSNKPLIYPQKVLHSLLPSLLANKKKLAIITPDKEQIVQSKNKWDETGIETIVVAASPYKEENQLSEAISDLKKRDIDIVVMDCIGYNKEMKEMVSKSLEKPVILARTMIARVVGEILQ